MSPRRRMAVAVACAASQLVLGLSGGCASTPEEGLSARSAFDPRYRSVAVSVFRNDSDMRDFERDLASSLVHEIELSTPYKVRSEGAADTVLRGSIRRIDLVQLSKSPSTGLANEMMVRMRADFEWVDLRTGKRIVAREGVEASALFVPSYPAREPLELGRLAAAEQLSRDLVGMMQSEW